MWRGRCHQPSSCRPRPAVRTCARGKTLVGRGAVLTCIPLYIVTAPYWIGKGISANIPVSLWIGIIFQDFLAILICQIWWIIFINIVLKSLENVDIWNLCIHTLFHWVERYLCYNLVSVLFFCLFPSLLKVFILLLKESIPFYLY